MTSTEASALPLTSLRLVRDAGSLIDGNLGVCGFIRGLDAAAETLTRHGVDIEDAIDELRHRARRIAAQDQYHAGCSSALNLAANLLLFYDRSANVDEVRILHRAAAGRS